MNTNFEPMFIIQNGKSDRGVDAKLTVKIMKGGLSIQKKTDSVMNIETIQS